MVEECKFRAKLKECLDEAMNGYFRQMDGQPPVGLYKMVGDTVDEVVIAHAFARCGQNRSDAARALGISRTTLSRKLMGGAKKTAKEKSGGIKSPKKKFASRRKSAANRRVK